MIVCTGAFQRCFFFFLFSPLFFLYPYNYIYRELFFVVWEPILIADSSFSFFALFFCCKASLTAEKKITHIIFVLFVRVAIVVCIYFFSLSLFVCAAASASCILTPYQEAQLCRVSLSQAAI